ncbi:MAG: heme-binding protein [Methylocella sp.]
MAFDQGSLPCDIPDATVSKIQKQLAIVVALPDANGGIFKPNLMWSAIVDRRGQICSVISIGDAWPGSRAIAIAKASTANSFSNDKLALSTANLYGPTQPGGSLYGLNNSNPFNPDFLAQNSFSPSYQTADNGNNWSNGQTPKVPGGIITFGGGVALYVGGKVIGGLGVSGDSSCADHAIAYRMRRNAGFDKIPAGVAPGNTDNIIYAATGTPPTGFQQPHCFPSDITP